MNEYISESTLYVCWIIGSVGVFSIAYAIHRWSIFIGNVRRVALLTLIGLAVFWGATSLFSGIVGSLGFGDYAILATIRVIGNTSLPWIVGGTLNWMVLASYRMSPEEQDLVRQTFRAFDRLGNVLHSTK